MKIDKNTEINVAGKIIAVASKFEIEDIKKVAELLVDFGSNKVFQRTLKICLTARLLGYDLNSDETKLLILKYKSCDIS